MLFSSSFLSVRRKASLFWSTVPPVSAVTFLIGLHVITMIGVALCLGFGQASWVNIFVYESSAVAHGQLWRLITYAFVASPSIWFALEMMMLYYFGRVVEKELGSQLFSFLYGGLIVLGAILIQLISLFGVPQQMSGAQGVGFAIFAAFVALYPDMPFLFNIRARWMLLALLAISSLQLLEAHQFAAATLFLSESVAALLFMIWRGHRGFFSNSTSNATVEFLKKMMTPPAKKTAIPKNSTLLGSASITTSIVTAPAGRASFSKRKMASSAPSFPKKKEINIDALLEKISQTGMASLTEEEKQSLEKARVALLERDR